MSVEKENNKRIFEIYGDNYKRLIEFEEKHKKSCFDKYHDSTGTFLSYTFLPTGFGYIVYVECPCGKKLKLSDLNL